MINLLLPMSLCIGFCLAASLAVAVTVVPAAASTLLKKAEPKPLPWFDRLKAGYGRSLAWCLDHRALPLAAAVLLLAFCGWRVVSMGVELIPQITSNEAIITVTTEKDISREESYAVIGEVLDAVLKVENVEEVGVSTDTSIAGVDISQLGLSSQITSMLNSASSYGKYQVNALLREDCTTTEIEAARQAIEAALAGVEGCTAAVEIGGLQELTNSLASGLQVQIFGADPEVLNALSDKVVEMINSTEGFANASNGLGSGDATIEMHIDRDKVRAYGLTVAQVYQQIAARLTTTATAETPVTVDGATMVIQVTDNLDPVTKENMMGMTFETTVVQSDGTTLNGTCTLGDIAEWTTGITPDSITSTNQVRYVTVSGETLEGYNTTVQARALQKKLDDFAASAEMPEGYTFSMGGESDTVNYMMHEMIQWMALALPFVYLVMVAQFQSLLSPFVVLFTVPLGFTGGLLGMLLTGQQLNMITLMGFIVLMGTVVNNGIVFVDFVNQLRIGGLDRRAALIATGQSRMRPILMTTLTTVLAMVQLALSNDMAGQLMRGMAVVIIFGLSYATLMTLYIVPVLYDLLFRRPPLNVDVGSDNLDDIPDDAAEFLAQSQKPAPAEG